MFSQWRQFLSGKSPFKPKSNISGLFPVALDNASQLSMYLWKQYDLMHIFHTWSGIKYHLFLLNFPWLWWHFHLKLHIFYFLQKLEYIVTIRLHKWLLTDFRHFLVMSCSLKQSLSIPWERYLSTFFIICPYLWKPILSLDIQML